MNIKFAVVFALAVVAASVWSGTISLSPIGGDTQSASSADEVVKVKAKGVGADKTEALKDAYRDAVERAVGMFVDAEQMVKNDEAIKDEILTQSNAYIKKCDIVSEQTQNGVVMISVLAYVVRQPLTKRIKDVMPPQTYNLESGALNVHASMVTEMKRNEDAAALVKKMLSDFNPITQLMKVGLVSPKPMILPVKGDDSRVNLAYLMKVELDEQKYKEVFVPKFKQVFDQISLTKPKMVRMTDITTKTSLVKHGNDYGDHLAKYISHYSTERGYSMLRCNGYYDGVKLYCGNMHGKATGFVPNVYEPYLYVDGVVMLVTSPYDRFAESTGCMEILLWTELNSTGSKAYLYTVDEKVALVIEEWKKRIASLTTEYSIIFKGRSGEEVGAFSWVFQPDNNRENNDVLNNVASVANGGLRMEDGSNRRLLVINHLVRGWAKRYVEWKAFEFHSDDVAKISAVSIELAE